MEKLDRSQVLTKQEALKGANVVLEKEIIDAKFQASRRLDHFGFVSELQSLADCVEAMTYVKSKSATNAEAFAELGLEDQTETGVFLGYQISVWVEDIKTRTNQIKKMVKIEQNKQAISLLENHLSEDDKFNRDMAAVGDILGSTKINLKRSFKSSVEVDEDNDEDENY